MPAIDAVVHAEPVMGTVVSFYVAPGELGPSQARAIVETACTRLHQLDATFSTWVPDSPMSLVRAGCIDLESAPSEIALVLELCRQARELSKGWFDPWAMPGGVDPTGLVKGWAVEQAANLLTSGGVEVAVVNGGGDIALLGQPPEGDAWHIAIRHPFRGDAYACVLEVEGAVATSGSYERGWHLVNPRDGRRANCTASATVTGPSLAIADALATALAAGGEQAFELFESLESYEAYWIGVNGFENATDGLRFADPSGPPPTVLQANLVDGEAVQRQALTPGRRDQETS